MKKLILATIFTIITATPCMAGFIDFSLNLDFSPPVTVVVGPQEILELLLANGTDNLTTPTGDQLTTPQ